MQKDNSGDWKTRQAKYEKILDNMKDPEPELLKELDSNIVSYLSDPNPNCIHTVLLICDLYFKKGQSINYLEISNILIDKAFTTGKQANNDIATNLVMNCIDNCKNQVFLNVCEKLSSKSPKVVKAILLILKSFLEKYNESDECNTIIKFVSPLTTNRDPLIRKESSEILKVAQLRVGGDDEKQESEKNMASKKTLKPVNSVKQEEIKKEQHVKTQIQKKESPKKEIKSKEKSIKHINNALDAWESWVSQDILENLNHHKWNYVVEGINGLKRMYNEEDGNPTVCAYGLSTIFIGKTFTPKVMNILTSDILFYLKEANGNLTDDTILAVLNFINDKLSDKKLETVLFEIADIICEISSPWNVLNSFCHNFTAKSPMLLLNTLHYLIHCLQKFGKDDSIHAEEIMRQISNLISHSDQNIRKSVNECISLINSLFGEIILDENKPKQNSVNNEQIVQQPKTNIISQTKKRQSTIGIKQKIQAQQNRIPDDGKEQNDLVSKLPTKRTRASLQPKSSTKVIKNNDNDFEENDNELIPKSALDIIFKSNSILEYRKAFDEIAKTLSKHLEANEKSSFHYSDFEQLFSIIKKFFKENKSALVGSLVQVLDYSFQLINKDDIQLVPKSFLSEMFLLFGYSGNNIKTTLTKVLVNIGSLYQNFVKDVFLPMFSQLNDDCKKSGILVITELDFEMNIEDYLELILFCLIDDSLEINDRKTILVQKYLMLPNSLNYIKKSIKSLPLTKKEYILSQLDSSNDSIFDNTPTINDKKNREDSIDSSIFIKIINTTCSISIVTNILSKYCKNIFRFQLEQIINDKNQVSDTCEILAFAAKNEFEKFELVIDIIFLWWTRSIIYDSNTQCLFSLLTSFLKKVLLIFKEENKRKLTTFELKIILPIIFEFSGKGFSQFDEIENLILENSSLDLFVEVTVQILNEIESVDAIKESANIILKNVSSIDQCNKSQFNDIITKLNKNSKQIPEFAEIANSFINVISSQSVSNQRNRNSKCSINQNILNYTQESEFMVYNWISSISSCNINEVIKAIKAISGQLQIEPKVIEKHNKALLTSIIIAMHKSFEANQIRLSKYLAFCLLTLFDESSLSKTITDIEVQQVIFEMITQLSNNIDEPILNQVLNAIIVKIIDTAPIFAFRGLLKTFDEYQNPNLNDKWILLAIKCFEACCSRIADAFNESIIIESLIILNDFFKENSSCYLMQTSIEKKFMRCFQNYLKIINQKDPNLLSYKLNGIINPKSHIFKLL